MISKKDVLGYLDKIMHSEKEMEKQYAILHKEVKTEKYRALFAWMAEDERHHQEVVQRMINHINKIKE